jgi:uncharacterized glyoxalase superfamily protein PhnB
MTGETTMQTITPYLLYEDVAAALDWLTQAFGCTEGLRFTDPEGQVTHAEIRFGAAEVMLGHPGPTYTNPRRNGQITAFTHVYVDDVDAHFAQAKSAGAEILSVVEDKPYGDRAYDAADPEGHRWTFAQHMRDVPPSEWGATASTS